MDFLRKKWFNRQRENDMIEAYNIGYEEAREEILALIEKRIVYGKVEHRSIYVELKSKVKNMVSIWKKD